MAPGLPLAKMSQYLFDDLIILDEPVDFHSALTLWTQQGVNIVNFLDQTCPVFDTVLFNHEICLFPAACWRAVEIPLAGTKIPVYRGARVKINSSLRFYSGVCPPRRHATRAPDSSIRCAMICRLNISPMVISSSTTMSAPAF